MMTLAEDFYTKSFQSSHPTQSIQSLHSVDLGIEHTDKILDRLG